MLIFEHLVFQYRGSESCGIRGFDYLARKSVKIWQIFLQMVQIFVFDYIGIYFLGKSLKMLLKTCSGTFMYT
jgi:hypothetical protein